MLPPGFTLYYTTKSSAEVIRRALDHVGAVYEIAPIDTAAGEQQTPAYLAINPKGRVPALRFNDTILTENPAILLYLANAAPAAGLLPGHDDPVSLALVLADLLWCSATLHPAIRTLRAPAKFTVGDVGPVKARALQNLGELAAYAESRLASGHWIAGCWSILDTYVAWGFAAAEIGGFDLSAFPLLRRIIDKEKPIN